MTETFFRLPEAKRNKIIREGLREFGHRGFERGTLDRVVEQSGISKGGFYEYTPSKEDFFLFLVDRAYGGLYRHLEERLGPSWPGEDLLKRLETASREAVDYYFEHPDCVRLLEKNTRLDDPILAGKVQDLFRRYFDPLFSPGPDTAFRFSGERVTDLLRWILLKTRSTYLDLLESGADRETIRREYLAEWAFHLSVLRNGLYR